MKRKLLLTWYWIMMLVDLYLIHPWWDKLGSIRWLDEPLLRFCLYAHGGYILTYDRE